MLSSSLLRRAPPAISFITTAPLYRPYSSHSSPKSHARPPSSAQPTSSTIPSTSSIASHPLPDDVNPPPSTRPADLILPAALDPSAPAADKAKRLIALGRAYLSFYKTGLKNVYHNYRASIPIRQSLHLPAYLPSSPSFSLSSLNTPLSRANFQLIHRAAHDVRRMIPFSIMLIICGEMTPLVVLALGNAVTPLTCRIPTQLAKSRRLRALRKSAALRAHRAATTGSVSSLPPGSDPELRILQAEFTNPAWIAAASASEVLRACAALGLARSHAHPPEPLVSLLRYRARLANHAAYIARDDALIREGGGVAALEAAEVSIAVDERGGVDVSGDLSGWEAERAERRWLQRWLRQE
ncbi:hypothetical protein BDW42DRAFT_50628 [Aspergillus taichungensis]|uniref:Letm1 RBD domain-containing protein n=1 Tax=Aspergillus taichungensis TaxID=482145 RepID=A0A2J5HDJ4_9EURO|nr:hypothetical protein BDW42DRAFT_50628 [Aspergillus taichungensis]